jgi:hypothetical protein
MAARAAFIARFEKEVDPERTLPVAERARRAESARRAHMSRLALASSKARRARKKGPAPVEPGADRISRTAITAKRGDRESG